MVSGSFADADSAPATWSHTGYVGVMTEDRVEQFSDGPELAGNQLIGYAIAYDRPLNRFWSVGFELQATYHFGDQEYYEFGLPLTVRYRPEAPWINAVESFAFGLGMSHATKVPDVEVETRGGSRRNLIYWMLEAEFATNDPTLSWFARIHHRSDAWGTLKPEGGSNALAFGLRKDF
jgi:hypothetical protein